MKLIDKVENIQIPGFEPRISGFEMMAQPSTPQPLPSVDQNLYLAKTGQEQWSKYILNQTCIKQSGFVQISAIVISISKDKEALM